MRYTKIELLAPARDARTAAEALRHGADAVYIGGPRFGARREAGNPISDIKAVCQYAHLFRAKVYVTLNTILRDDELEEARALAWELYDAGIDALIVQDLALLEMDMPPLPLHASTQMNNCTSEQVRWLQSLGFSRAVLARELSLDEISSIHRQVPDMPLEVFVHGSICVSYNGQCYASQHCFSRSANRGECAQFCRLPFDLVDADGHTMVRQRHLLSLRDMNRSHDLEALLDAGATSLKIEGRLKDTAYVKNVVAYYRQRLDEIFSHRPQDYARASLGHHTYTFEPRLEAVFNRGFTSYFLRGSRDDMCSKLTPKSTGEPVGEVKSVGERHIEVTGNASFTNGDGLCFFDEEGLLHGFKVNRAEGNLIFPHGMPSGLKAGVRLFRNFNQALETQLSRTSATRKLPVALSFCETEGGFTLLAKVDEGIQAEAHIDYPHELANTEQCSQMERQLKRLGDTCFECDHMQVNLHQNWFVPASVLNGLRKEVVKRLEECLRQNERKPGAAQASTAPFRGNPITYQGNVANSVAEAFYLKHGATSVDKAMEVEPASAGDEPLLMTCRYCILNELGRCMKDGESALSLPLLLRLADGRRFPLKFNCAECKMTIYAERKDSVRV